MSNTRRAEVFAPPSSQDAALAGGFVLAFHWPLHAAPVNEPAQPPDHPDGQFAPNAFIRIDTTGKTTLVMPQVEMGQGVYTSIAMILAEELDGEFCQGRGRARAAERQALRQSDLRHPGHRQFQFDPRVLDAVAQGRRRGADDAHRGRRATMAGRAVNVHGRRRQGHPCRQQPHARLWRARRCRGASCRCRRSPR